MFKFCKKIIKDEKGQALMIAFALLVIGGLTIVPSLGLNYTSAKTSNALQTGVKGTYAADAGIEDALWSLANSQSPPTQLPGNINGMRVDMQTVDRGSYTLYFDELVEPANHSDYLDVTSNMTWDAGANAYKYTITVTWLADPGSPPIFLEEAGARIPPGFSYQAGSAANITENLSTDEPDETLDSQGAYMLNWVLGSPSPKIDENIMELTQIFYITGSGNEEGHYTWVLSRREDVGAVGQINGTYYDILATASNLETNEVTAKIAVKAILGGGDTHITSWQINN
jgi:hypothetical protein